MQIACFLFGTDASSGAIFVFLTPGLVAKLTGLCELSFSIRTRSLCAVRLARVVNTPLRHCSLLELSFFELCSVRFETPLSGSVEQSSTRQRQEVDPPDYPSGPSTSSSCKERSPPDVREPPKPKQARYFSPAEREDSKQKCQRPSEVKSFQRKPNCSLDKRATGKTRSNAATSYETRPYEEWWK